MSASSYDPSLPLQDSSYLPGERMDTIMSGGSGDSHLVPSSSSVSTMREYEDQLNSFKRENLNLKLRIYMMENAIGFHGNDEKHVLKLNVDLRVENEELKKELSDRKELLGQAYSTLSNFEEVYKSTEAKVESLELENDKLRETNKKIISRAKRLTKGGDEDVAVDILEDAFGTLTEDDEPFFMDNLQKNILGIIFGEELIPEREEDILEAVKRKMQKKSSSLSEEEVAQWIASTNEYLMRDSMPDSLSFKTYNNLGQSVKSALEKLSELANTIRIKNQLLFRLEDELEQSKKMCDDLEAKSNALRDSQKQLESRSKENDTLAKELDTKSEKLTKSYEFCQSLTKALAEQKSFVEKYKKDLKARDGMIKKLTDEYNDLKAKVRARGDFQPNHKVDSKVAIKEASSLGTSEEILSLIRKFRDDSIHKGCVAAMRCYQERMKSIQGNVSSAVKLMRGRLQELADFLQRLLDANDSNDEQRRLSKDFLETLQTSLSETRRLSASFLGEDSSMLLNGSLQFGEHIMDEIELAFKVDEREMETLLRECESIRATDLSNEDIVFFKGIQREVLSSNSSSELQELKSSLEEERLLVEKMSEIQLELKKELDVVKEESELKSDEIKRVYSELSGKSSRIQDVEGEIRSLSGQLEEIHSREEFLKSDHLEEVQSLKSQLSDSVASKENLLGEIRSLTDEKNKILQCCSENEDLRENLRRAKEDLDALNDMLARDKAKRADIEKQMTKQLLKTRKVLKQTRQIGSEDSTDKEN